jgi:hypothetical protein
LWEKERSSRVHQDVLEGPIQVERVGVSGRCCYVSMQLTVIAGLAEPMAVLVKTRPGKQSRQMVRCGAGTGVACGIMDHADQVQPVLQRWYSDPTSGSGNMALEERWTPGVDPVAARAAPKEAGCCWCDILGKNLEVQVAHQRLVRKGILWPIDQGGLAVVQLAGLVAELGVAAWAEKATRWWKAARWDQAVEMESTLAAVADQHGLCALCAIAQGTGQVFGDWGRKIGLSGRSAEDSQGVR